MVSGARQEFTAAHPEGGHRIHAWAGHGWLRSPDRYGRGPVAFGKAPVILKHARRFMGATD